MFTPQLKTTVCVGIVVVYLFISGEGQFVLHKDDLFSLGLNDHILKGGNCLSLCIIAGNSQVNLQIILRFQEKND